MQINIELMQSRWNAIQRQCLQQYKNSSLKQQINLICAQTKKKKKSIYHYNYVLSNYFSYNFFHFIDQKYSVNIEMQQKNNKTILPQTYDQFITMKKKQNKQMGIPSFHRTSVNVNQQQRKRTIPNEIKQNKPNQDNDGQYQNVKPVQIQEVLVYSDYQKLFEEFNNSKFDLLRDKMKTQIQKLKESKPVEIVSVNSILKDLSIQSLENIRNLQQQFAKPANKRNIDSIDAMLSFNKFFVILNREKRYKIYDQAKFMAFQEGQLIYEEGSFNDHMYVVLKGCANQFEKKSTTFNQKVTVNFITYYQGSSFGQSLIVSEGVVKSKRYNSVVAAQKSYLLQIQNDFYRDLITNSKQDDFQKKLASMLSTSIFKDTSKIFVMPLVSTIERITLDYGQTLINQGEEVRKLYFIAEGNLQLIYVDRARRNINHLNIVQKPQNFYIKKPQSQKKSRKAYSIHNTFYVGGNQQNTDKSFIYGKKKIIGDELEYNDHVIFEQLRIGDFLGGKSFLTQKDIEKKNEDDPLFSTELQSKLTVISSSIVTIIYALDQKKFFSLSDNLQKVIIEGIMASRYFDQIDIESRVSQQRQWKQYSEKLVENVIKNKKHRNHSFRN